MMGGSTRSSFVAGDGLPRSATGQPPRPRSVSSEGGVGGSLGGGDGGASLTGFLPFGSKDWGGSGDASVGDGDWRGGGSGGSSPAGGGDWRSRGSSPTDGGGSTTAGDWHSGAGGSTSQACIADSSTPWTAGAGGLGTGMRLGSFGTSSTGPWPAGMATVGMWPGSSCMPEWWPAMAAAGITPNFFPSDPDAPAAFPGLFAAPANDTNNDNRAMQAPLARGGGRRGTSVADKSLSTQVAANNRKRKRNSKAQVPPSTSDNILDLTVDPADVPDARSSDSDMDESRHDDRRLKTLALMSATQSNLFTTSLLLGRYFMNYYDKNEPMIPEQSGHGWMMEVLRSPRGSQKIFRMSRPLFYRLHELLVSKYGLRSSTNMNSMEALAMFLAICGHGWSNSAVQHIFKHSSETISRKFNEVLHVVVRVCKDYIRPIDPNFSTTHKRITGDRRMMPFFKDCIGAIDGTHISAVPHPKDYIRYIGRSGKPTQNVMAVVDFDLRFTYASIGQPGSMHDTNVLFHALKDNDFPHPPIGKYYHVDAGYPNRPGYLAPYKGERYHIPDWRRGVPPRGEQEHFNHLHSSIRNAVERTFGVFKMKWRINIKMPSYSMEKQMMIVAATMCLHNFVRENNANDKHFRKCDRNQDYVPTIPQRPFGCGVILGGYDRDGPQLYMIEPSGLSYKYSGAALGKGRQAAKTEIEKLKLSELTCREGIVEVAKIIYGVHDEAKDKAFELELSWICDESNRQHQKVPNDLLEQAKAAAQAALEEMDAD